MAPTSDFCRAQEALQRKRATETTLANVRAIAEKAADAWAVEGRLANGREQRQARGKSTAIDVTEIDLTEEEEAEDAEDARERAFSENPDRGQAHA